MSWLAFALAYAGLAALALAMTSHHRAVFGRPITLRLQRLHRAAGVGLLLAAGAALSREHGASVAVVVWFAQIAGAGFGLTALLAYAPRWLAAPAAALLLLALINPTA